MKFKLEIEMDNAAFEEPGIELKRILTTLPIHNLVLPNDGKWSKFFIESPEPIKDVNGNTVGYMVIKD